MAFTDIQDRVKNLVEFFNGSSSGLPYPTNSDIINPYEPKNWNKIIKRAYSFKVVDERGLPPVPVNFPEFNLQLNPQEMLQDENFSINITPTQNGVVSEHNGIVLRDLVISGTTGIHPLRGVGGVTKDGKSIGSGSKVRSGYEEFNQLRNYLRAYSEFQKNPPIKDRKFFLVFTNRKDIERLIVEPLKFSMKRQGAKGFLYNYTIVFRVLGNFKEKNDPKNKSFLEKFDDAVSSINDTLNTGVGLLLESADLLRQVEREVNDTLFEPLRQVDLAMKTIGGIGYQIWHMGDDLVGKLNASQTLSIFNSAESDDPSLKSKLPVNRALAASAGGVALLALSSATLNSIALDQSILSEEQELNLNNQVSGALLMPRSFFEDLAGTVLRIRDNSTDAFALGDDTYNTYAERTTTFTPSPTKQTTNEELDILFGFFQIQTALNLILSFDGNLTKKSAEDRLNDIENKFNNEINLPVPSSVVEIIIPPGSSLEDIAFENLGDITRWIELVEINNLMPPYVTDVSTNPRVKAYGDRLLLPSTGIQVDTNVRVVEENIYNDDLTETEKRLGIDFLLNSDFDFQFGNNSDIALAVGGKNIEQAINIKLHLEKGDLRYHPELGVGLIIGEKGSDYEEVLDAISNTILADPRIEQITSFRLYVDGSTVLLNLNLRVAESETPVPANIAF